MNGDLYDVVKLSTGYELPQPKYTRGNDMRKAFAEYKRIVRAEAAEENSREIAANMLREQIPISKIEKWTRLSQEQILQIAKANNISLP